MEAATELLFPHRCVSTLRGLGGPEWQSLIDRVDKLPDTHEESLAVALLVIRLAGCIDCQAGSYRAGLGCVTCARRAVRNGGGSGASLMRRYKRALSEVRSFLEKQAERQGRAA
jgi:hypothetical protein